MMRVLTGVHRSGVATTPSVAMPWSARRRRTVSPARSAPTTPRGSTFAPRVWRLWQALAAPPRRISRDRYRRIRTGASRETRSGFPKTYSSATRSPTTRMRRPSNRWTIRRSSGASALCTVRSSGDGHRSVRGDAHFRRRSHRRHYTDGLPAGKRFFSEYLSVDGLHPGRSVGRRELGLHPAPPGLAHAPRAIPLDERGLQAGRDGARCRPRRATRSPHPPRSREPRRPERPRPDARRPSPPGRPGRTPRTPRRGARHNRGRPGPREGRDLGSLRRPQWTRARAAGRGLPGPVGARPGPPGPGGPRAAARGGSPSPAAGRRGPVQEPSAPHIPRRGPHPGPAPPARNAHPRGA